MAFASAGRGNADPQGWDFFVSYTQADRAWAEWIAWQLEEDGHRVLVQAWDFVPGTNWVQSMHEGVIGAERTIAVLSAAYLESVYGGAEWQAAWAKDPTGRERKLLTMRVADCDRPGLLAHGVGVDLFGVGEGEARSRLRRAVATAIAGRGKPEQSPPFPPSQRAMARGARFPGALPRIWNVPARNPNFTGRGEQLSGLAAGLASGSTVTVHSVHGMGGVGKTQLATEFAYMYAGSYDVVWWIASEEPTLIPDQLSRLAAELGVEAESGEPDVIRSAVARGLADAAGWLLIFDNADQADAVRGWVPAVPLSPGNRGHALVTTRREGFDAIGKIVDLDVLGEADSVRLLRSRVPDIDEDVAREIAAELDRLPLALEQAAAFLNKSKLPAQEYLTLFRNRKIEMLREGTVVGRTDTIATLWDLSLDRLRTERPAAVELLGYCAYLAPVPIPLDLFTNHPDELPPALAAAARDVLAFNHVIESIVDYSLAKRTPEGLQLHRLVQAAIRGHHQRENSPESVAGP